MISSPVYTTENECQDCYKCVRHCPVKAIRIVDGKASVIPEACVACGECVKVCPAHAKKIRSDLARLKELVASGATLYASVAPSFAGYFKGVTIGQIAAALKAAGFAGVSETAHGAESVSAHVSKLLAETDSPLVISSACPAAVDMVRKYLPGYAEFISPLPSPVRAHCRLIKEKYGNNAKVVLRRQEERVGRTSRRACPRRHLPGARAVPLRARHHVRRRGRARAWPSRGRTLLLRRRRNERHAARRQDRRQIRFRVGA